MNPHDPLFVAIVQATLIGFGSAFTAQYIAKQKGRCGWRWWLWGFLFGPFALVAIIAVPNLKESRS